VKRLLNSADEYLRGSGWKDLAVLKLCLLALGLLAGMGIPENRRKTVGPIAFLLFLCTYIPCMTRYLRILAGRDQA